MRTTKRLALGLALMMAMVLTSSEAAAQRGGGAYGRISATARVIELVVPSAQLATVIAEMVGQSTPYRRLPSGVYLTIIEAPAPISPPDIFGYSPTRYFLPAKTVQIEYPAY